MLRHLYKCSLFLATGCLLVPYCVSKAAHECLGKAIDRTLDLIEED
jgi:hypothetical protein